MHAEAARMVRTALLNRLSGACNHAVQVTSAGPGSGKSTVSILLARSLAQSGKSVLLVDADLRRPSLAKYFTIDASPGLINVLSQRETEARVIRATEIPQLSILTAGGMTRNEDVELLANGAFSSLLERWRKQFDLVLLDSSPLLSTADGAILSRQVDGTVLVVRERHCRRSALVEALATMSAAGGKLLGTVFVGSGHGGTYAYGYDYHYESVAQPLDVHEETRQRADG
ncbi:MAG: CpsD/CapB family tyrosine-protein kinase [Planctomycetes bacterium]|nr:CpsD/CapB family tyrosine-protein kinase [Planctomycetota bacterium]